MGWKPWEEPAGSLEIDTEVNTLHGKTYKWKKTSNGRTYHWWVCPYCHVEIGACGYRWNLNGAVLFHFNDCQKATCDEPSCINCKPSPVRVVDAV